MASIILRTAKRHFPLQPSCLAQCSVLVRQIHVSPPATSPRVDDDLFSDEPETRDQFQKAPQTNPLSSKFPNPRERKFNELLQFVSDRTGQVKVVKAGQVRSTVWLRLFQLATKAEHLESVVEIIPKWRESGKSFSALEAEMFVRRCEELKCPLLALKVFGDHPKYGFSLSSFFAARNLLHSLYGEYPVENTIAAASLFGVYKLPSVTSDPVCSAMLYAACIRSKNKNAALLGRDLRLRLKELLEKTKPFAEPKGSMVRALYSTKPNIWLLEALRDIKETKREQGRGTWWITEWIWKGEGRELPPLPERRYQAKFWTGPQRPVEDAQSIPA
ncbi:hypothetical protein PAXRUDRAFT_831758 [Paxillus rubicundulus Ve08.2h10]|uniref:Uncharacterized protein n=1 Tax=Paxillus rubicundulus Ve08.2h10 TaxID=930991 RepID=A0A0D0DVP8_9AGAM|nr:hypothetical protein PAXRUDRAFT_831758 [Paxillus rubicundulus Ve08.2h10]